MIKEAKIP